MTFGTQPQPEQSDAPEQSGISGHSATSEQSEVSESRPEAEVHAGVTVPAPAPAWARPVAPVQYQDSDELEYHELLRGAPRYRWWKPIVALVTGVFYFFTLSFLIGLVAAPMYSLITGGSLLTLTEEEIVSMDTQNPVMLLISLLSIVIMLPSAALGMWSAGLGTPKRLWSVALKIRWRWILRTIIPAIAALLLTQAVAMVLTLPFMADADLSEVEVEPSPYDLSLALWSLLIILILVPLQATAEEVVFRGGLMQMIGSWTGGASSKSALGRAIRSPWLAILLPSIGFSLLHIYNVWGLLQVGVMGLVAAWLTWRTGGLEAAITLHVMNNLWVFMFLVFAVGGETGQRSDGGGLISAIAVTVGLCAYGWWVDRDFKRKDGRRTRIDRIEVRAGTQLTGAQA